MSLRRSERTVARSKCTNEPNLQTGPGAATRALFPVVLVLVMGIVVTAMVAPGTTRPVVANWQLPMPAPTLPNVWHVATTGSDVTGDGSESNPFATIQHGIDVSIDGDTVLVHPGTYTENIDFEGKNIVVGSLFVTTGDDEYISQTVIDGDQNGSVVTFTSGEGPAAVLSGLTIANGHAHEASWPTNSGGGVCVVDAAPHLTHLRVISNSAISEGGGVYLGQNQSSLDVARISDCVIRENSAGSTGGGIRFSSDNGRIAVVENAEITGNSAQSGGGVHIYHSGILENCLISNNSATFSGGAVYVDWGSRGAYITNSTIVDNSAPSFGGLDYIINGASVKNTIIYNNDNGNWRGGTYTHSCTTPLPSGDGNIDQNPHFADAGVDYHLADSSPCIGAGTTDGAPATDIEGNQRPDPVGSDPDMGAYEHPLGVPSPPVPSFNVDQVAPSPNALNVALDASIIITFTADADPATLSDSTIRVNGAQSGLHTGAVTYDSATRTATFIPDTVFKTGETVDVMLTSGIQSTTHEPLPRPLGWSFLVAVPRGSGDFSLSSTAEVGTQPHGIAIGDWDGDGDLDLAVSNHNSGNVSVLMNSGDGSYTPSQTLSAEPWTYPPAAGDFDRDGDLDLAVPCRAYGHVLIFVNDGHGTFSPAQTLSVGPEPQFVIVRDFDGDGDPDFVVLCNSASVRKVVTFTNDGNGHFGEFSTIVLNTSRTDDFASGDFDGDGDWDLYVPAAYPQLVLFNQGDGSFSQEAQPGMGDRAGTPVVADFDVDGDVDLMVPNYASQVVTLFQNDGTGHFTAATTIPVPFAARNIAGGDLDGDGDLDLAVPNGDLDIVSILENDGGFTLRSTVAVSSTSFIASGDLDDDGDLDLATANLRHGTVSILTNTAISPPSPTVTFTRIITGDIVNDGGHSSGACWGDYDDDGHLDLVVTNWLGGDNFLYHNNGDGTFVKITTGAIANDGGWSRGCTWGDYDNDGWLDLFVSNDGGGNFLYHNIPDTASSSRTFERVTDSPIAGDGGNCYGTAWVDYDNDGWLDLFVARHTNANNLLYHNNGDGTFTKITSGAIVNDGGYSVSVSWGNYDDDGCIDLFVGNINGQDNFLYHNDCHGTFDKITSGPVVTDGGNTSSSNWVDYDNAIDLDLFVANWAEDNFLYQNNGDGTFTKIETSVIVTEGDVHNSSWADYDSDGDVDLFMGPTNGALHRLYRNNGDRTFTRVTEGPIVEDGGSSSAVWGDYDRDGDLDLFVARDGNNLLYRNEGSENHWVDMELIGAAHHGMVPGTASNSSAIGARVTVSTTINGVPVEQFQELSGQTGLMGQNSLNVEFGLGDATVLDSVEVRWPSGRVQTMENVAVDQFLTIRELRPWIFLPFVVRSTGP